MIQKKILVVDNEKNNRFLMAAYLLGEGYQVVVAKNDKDGLKKLGSENFDVMFLDLGLPDVDYIQFLNRSKELNPLIDIVMMSAFNEAENIQNASSFGVRRYLEKPFTTVDVNQVLQEVFT
jgi:two-component system response regulator (stage 0 sporulation protein F)